MEHDIKGSVAIVQGKGHYSPYFCIPTTKHSTQPAINVSSLLLSLREGQASNICGIDNLQTRRSPLYDVPVHLSYNKSQHWALLASFYRWGN
jgi:hypothetical protein